jgi:hypothetical protein
MELFEAELKNNSGIPDKYFEKLVQRGRALYGRGPVARDHQEFANYVYALFAIQNGHEDELTEIGKDIIMKHYGSILHDVKLDIKIIKPGDPEQVELAQEMISPPQVEVEEEDITNLKDEIDKRKILNVVMQGESQNIHDLLYFEKDRLDDINPDLLKLDLALIKKDIFLHWDDNLDLQAAMEQIYTYTNVVKVTWPEEEKTEKMPEPDQDNLKSKPYKPGQEEDDKEEKKSGNPTIVVRALMLSGLIHETVKGIYELIAARGIGEDEEKFKRVLSQTDTLENEQEDLQFGSFVAADLRDFVNKATEGILGADMPNIREFVFGHLAEMPAKEFLIIMKGILANDADTMKEMKQIINLLVKQIKNETAEFHAYQPEKRIQIPETPPQIKKSEVKKEEKPEKKKKKWVEYGQGELKYMLDQAIDNKNWDLVKEIQPWIKESLVMPSIKIKN